MDYITIDELKEYLVPSCMLTLYLPIEGNYVYYSKEHKSHISGTVYKVDDSGFMISVTNKRFSDSGCHTSYQNIRVEFDEIEKWYNEGKIRLYLHHTTSYYMEAKSQSPNFD